MAEKIIIRKLTGTWSVRAGGAVLGETKNAMELSEGDLAPVIFFPREDIAMAFLDRTEKTANYPQRGDASFFSVVTKSTTLKDAVWSFETPDETALAIKNHLAFQVGDTITVEST